MLTSRSILPGYQLLQAAGSREHLKNTSPDLGLQFWDSVFTKFCKSATSLNFQRSHLIFNKISFVSRCLNIFQRHARQTRCIEVWNMDAGCFKFSDHSIVFRSQGSSRILAFLKPICNDSACSQPNKLSTRNFITWISEVMHTCDWCWGKYLIFVVNTCGIVGISVVEEERKRNSVLSQG